MLKRTMIRGFTIVELLVVIVVIGILAAISIVSYAGITERAIAARIKSDLNTNTKLLELYKIEHDEYPRTIGTDNCPETPEIDDKYCLKVSDDEDTLIYEGDGGTGGGAGDTYTLTITDEDTGKSYEITPGGVAVAVESGNQAAVGTTFVNAWGRVNSDYGYSIVQTDDGGYAITGETSNDGASDYDMFIAKYDSTGMLIWDKTWGGVDGETGYSIVQTSDGGYAITGRTYGYGAGMSDMFITKFDSAGNLSWDRTWGGANSDTGHSIVQTSDGGYAVTGETMSYSADNYDMFIVKYDSSGDVVWDKTWGGTSYQGGESIIQTDDGGYMVSGDTSTFYSAGELDLFIVKYDSSGNVSWNKTWGGTSDERVHSIIQTVDGDYVITGQTESFGPDGHVTNDYNMFIAKFNSSGGLSWNKTWGGSAWDKGYSIVETTDGAYAVTGETDSFSGVDENEDVFIAKYDSSGSLLWDKVWGGADNEYGMSIVQAIDGGYAVTGDTYSYGAGDYDMFIAKFDLNGNIGDCPASMCKNPSAIISVPSAVISTPVASISGPVAAVSTPAASVSSPDATPTSIAPIIPPPPMTEYFSSQELYVTWPGDSQTVCREWTVPNGKTIKGFVVSQETEEGYDFFTVSSDGVEKYNKSGYITDSYINISATPGTTLSACMTTDDSTQDGFGGEVTGVLYD